MDGRRVPLSLVALVASGCMLDFDGLTGGAAPVGASGASGAAGAGVSGASGAGAAGKGGGGSGGAIGGSGGAISGTGGAIGGGGGSGGGVSGSAGAPVAGEGGSAGASAGSGGAGVGGSAAGSGGAGAAGKGGAGSGGAGAGGAGSGGKAGSAGCSNTATDPKNCGACGRDCLGGACSGGVCAPAIAWALTGADGGPGVTAIALDDSNVYWTSPTSLYRQPHVGGIGSTKYLGAVDGVRAMAVSGSRLFIATKTQLDACDLPDCSSRGPVASGVPIGVAADSASVFWTDQGTPPDLTDGSVYRCGLFGCGSPTLLTQSKNEWNPAGIALSGGFVYFADRADPSTGSGYVRRVSASGAGSLVSEQIAGPLGGPLAVAAFSGKIYWTETGAQPAVRFCDEASCAPSLVVQDGASPYPIVESRALVVDAGGVMWTNDAASSSGSTVLLCPTTGCPAAPKLVKSGLVKPSSLAAKGSFVFFGDASKSGTLWRWVR